MTDTLPSPAPATTRPPRVVLACDWLLKYAAGLAQGLREAGAEVALVTRDHGLEWGGDAEEMRADLQARLGGGPLWLLSGRIRELDGLRQVRRIRSEVQRVRRRRHAFPAGDDGRPAAVRRDARSAPGTTP